MKLTLSHENNSELKFSVITVVFNDRENIQKTIDSIKNQTFKNFEYIIIDGGSTDGTTEIIEENSLYIDTFISEKDKGIYDAMNKGIKLASGEYVNFMNSGDVFHSDKTLSVVAKKINNADVLYGLTEMVNGLTENRVYSPNDPLKFYFNLPFNHQSAFIKTEIHKDNLYNINFPIYSDFILFYTLHKKGLKFQRINEIIATYDTNGISADISRKSLIERYKAGNIVHGRIKNFTLFFFFTVRRLINDLKS